MGFDLSIKENVCNFYNAMSTFYKLIKKIFHKKRAY